MKRRYQHKMGAFFLITSCMVLCGCGNNTTTRATHIELDSKPLRFMFIAPCKDEAFFDPVKKGMHDAAERMNVQCVFTGTQDVDLSQQAALVRQAVRDGYNGIALSIIDTQAFDKVIQETIDKGVPVVAFNVDDHATPNARLSAVCQNLYQAGVQLGQKADESIPAGANVIAAMHSENISALEDRYNGMKKALVHKNLHWDVLITGTEPNQAARVITKALQKNPSIAAVLCTGQADTEGAGLARRQALEAGRDVYVAGFDLSENILTMLQAGDIQFTIDQQPYIQGFYPVVQLALYCRYGIQPASMDAGALIVTQEQAAAVMELKKKNYR